MNEQVCYPEKWGYVLMNIVLLKKKKHFRIFYLLLGKPNMHLAMKKIQYPETIYYISPLSSFAAAAAALYVLDGQAPISKASNQTKGEKLIYHKQQLT